MGSILGKLMTLVAPPELKAKDGAAAAGRFEASTKLPPVKPGGVRSKVNGKPVTNYPSAMKIRTSEPITGKRG